MNYFNYFPINRAALLIVLMAVTFVACDTTSPDVELDSATYNYAFNEGQVLGTQDIAYRGSHSRNLTASLAIAEMANGNAMITVTLMNTMSGVDYPVHAHDAADPATTPNGTPYNETPNHNVLAGAVSGNGGTASLMHESSMPYSQVVNNYEGFLVVHDPTQDISTTDLSTYLILGVFAQSLSSGQPMPRSQTFEYSFNEGQLLDNPATAYDGDHSRNLSATMLVEELLTGKARVTVTLNNTMGGFTYPVHSHDAADPATTPNGTPYNETPNSDIFASGIAGNNGSASASVETMNTRYSDLINNYEGFLVVHDPTQDISTTDLTTYLILGLTAR